MNKLLMILLGSFIVLTSPANSNATVDVTNTSANTVASEYWGEKLALLCNTCFSQLAEFFGQSDCNDSNAGKYMVACRHVCATAESVAAVDRIDQQIMDCSVSNPGPNFLQVPYGFGFNWGDRSPFASGPPTQAPNRARNPMSRRSGPDHRIGSPGVGEDEYGGGGGSGGGAASIEDLENDASKHRGGAGSSPSGGGEPRD